MRTLVFTALALLSSVAFSSSFAFGIDQNAPEVFFASGEECHHDEELGGTVCIKLCRFSAELEERALNYLHNVLKNNCRSWGHGGLYYMRFVRALSVPKLPDMLEFQLFTLQHDHPSARFQGSALIRSFCRHAEF